MFIRDINGNLVKINVNNFNSEKELYSHIWKEKYNININDNSDPVDMIVDYIQN